MNRDYGVIKLYEKDAIAYISMEEKQYKNTFTQDFVDGLLKAFDDIAHSDYIKCVVVHGYDNYFSCGGTKEELTGLYNSYAGIGKTITFSDTDFYKLFLKCSVPVIAAMQGHALGGGLALACFADVLVMAREAMYCANFMNYGFTPGMGATYIIPCKFGELVSMEMLYTGKSMFGRDLEKRGIGAIFANKEDVITVATSVATEIAKKPLSSLKVYKAYNSARLMPYVDQAVENELKMHQVTFSQPEVLQNINKII